MTFRTIGIEIDDAVYQRAVSKAARERKTIGQVLTELLTGYAGPAPVTTPPVSQPATTTPAAASVYVVQSGDTLSKIARKVYGNAHLYQPIQQANNIQDPRRIWVGQRLVIPALGTTGQPGTTTATTTTPSSPPPAVTTPSPTTPTATGQAGRNPRPEPIRFVGSPNFNRRPRNEISAIVVHATANSTLNGVVAWFNNPQAQASAHYTIDKDGTIVQHVRDTQRAWHAGVSSWQGRSNLNDWSIGIELVNLNTGHDPFPEAQHQANLKLVAYLAEKYQIRPEFIVAHYDVSPGRKTDPINYDMNRLRREVAARL